MNYWGILVGGIFVAGLGLIGWRALQPSAAVQGHSMVPPDTSEIAQGAALVDLILPAELSADAQIGKRGFEAACAQCHGQNAAGQNGIAPPLVHIIYEPNHHGDAAFILAAQNGVRAHHWNFGNMPPVDGVTQADVKFITQYIRELQRANGIE